MYRCVYFYAKNDKVSSEVSSKKRAVSRPVNCLICLPASLLLQLLQYKTTGFFVVSQASSHASTHRFSSSTCLKMSAASSSSLLLSAMISRHSAIVLEFSSILFCALLADSAALSTLEMLRSSCSPADLISAPARLISAADCSL